ncbi:MAG: hypothetical protein JJ902_05000 [Roseibium sp.]|nr:hypothetical protein [Roseibium sp.]
MRFLMACVLAGVLATGPALASDTDDDDDDGPAFGSAGILSRDNREDLPTLALSAGMPLLESGKLGLKSGTYYEVEIEADGSQELALAGAGFFRAIWIDEIVIEGIEIRPLGVDSLEFDEAGTAEISFLAIKPGTYRFGVPGSELQSLEITIE